MKRTSTKKQVILDRVSRDGISGEIGDIIHVYLTRSSGVRGRGNTCLKWQIVEVKSSGYSSGDILYTNESSQKYKIVDIFQHGCLLAEKI